MSRKAEPTEFVTKHEALDLIAKCIARHMRNNHVTTMDQLKTEIQSLNELIEWQCKIYSWL